MASNGPVQPYNPGGPPQWSPAQYGQALQSLQQINTTLNAMLAQMRTGIAYVSQVPTYAFADLPSAAAAPAVIVYCSDGRKPGEGVGAGTGMAAFSDGVDWFGTDGTILQV